MSKEKVPTSLKASLPRLVIVPENVFENRIVPTPFRLTMRLPALKDPPVRFPVVKSMEPIAPVTIGVPLKLREVRTELMVRAPFKDPEMRPWFCRLTESANAGTAQSARKSPTTAKRNFICDSPMGSGAIKLYDRESRVIGWPTASEGEQTVVPCKAVRRPMERLSKSLIPRGFVAPKWGEIDR